MGCSFYGILSHIHRLSVPIDIPRMAVCKDWMQDESFADRVKLTQNFFQAGSFSVFGGATETAETSSEPSKSKRAGSERHPEVPAAKDIQPQTLGKSSVQSFSDQNVDLEDQMNLLGKL